uniref:Clr5 domain-containing protein n=1 Tax=Bionectria ochroleuca TaxID=29856 RepID=A0A8H7NHJ7_BIOOC
MSRDSQYVPGQLICHMERPLTLAEAKEVIATRIENEPRGFDVKRRLYRDADDELHLAHFSVKEYLLRENKFDIISASSSITSTCLTYLTDIKGSHRGIKQDFPMARCAAKIWTRHAALTQESKDAARAIVKFLENEETFQRWACLYQPDRAWVRDPGLPQELYYVCFEGLVEPARGLIAQGADVNARGGAYGNALQAASSQGHQEIVVLLLNKGADMNAHGGEYGNALQAASSEGHREIVGLLLNKGADVNAQGGHYGNALYAASYRGHQEIVVLLLNKGADVNAQGGEYGNALYAASLGGHQEITALLQKKKARLHRRSGPVLGLRAT